MIGKFITFAATATACFSAASGASSAPSEQPVSIVLVHGAFVDGSGWKAVHDILSKDGYEVLVVQNPTISLEGDVADGERNRHGKAPRRPRGSLLWWRCHHAGGE